ncbi:flagellar biosynthesis regulator FlaF [Magnetospirillum sp. SS-4]|uniref:flagellar biosynthesis regulator FlaF n=1 Tax=Magnetospirillum sp. SS-4 TaxID=2681465 RepID=UPI001381C3AC|nr:flagellar biosynthesis regulator FlaF [Magnetospirillum sp. SS-4]CAA7612732.1 putative Flagellar FlaF family protein [Magnetospirillum sp. SS-4]
MAYPNADQGKYRSIPAGGNPRETEAWALTETARRMMMAQSDSVDIEEFLAAVRLNWRLWTIFQADLSTPECEVPLELRQNMLSLANFVDKRSVEIISSRNRDMATALININRQLAGGLFVVIPSKDAVEATQPAATSANEVI